MHGGPGYGGLRREIAQLLGKCRGRWDTCSTTTPGLTGGQGIGCDYVLGAGGLYVQSRSAHLVVRVLVAPGSVRGLAPSPGEADAAPRPHPGVYLFELGLRWFRGDPEHRAVLRGAMGRGRLPAGGAGARPGPPRPSPTRPPLAWSPSSTPTERPAPSSRPPTTRTSKASVSTESSGRAGDLKPARTESPGGGLRPLRAGGAGPRCSAALNPGVRLLPRRA